MRILLQGVAAAVLVSAAVAAGAATASRNVEIVTTGTAHRDLYAAILGENGTESIAVGDRGSLLVSQDGGREWDFRQLDTPLALLDVATNGDRRLVVGQMGLVRYSDDGETWNEAQSGSEERLLGVDLNDRGLAVAVGSFGTVLLSNDAGKTWRPAGFDPTQLVEDGYEPHFNDVHVTEDGTVLVVGEFGLVLRSDDGGENWRTVHQNTVSLFALQLRDDGVGYAVGQSGTVLRTADNGETWQELDTGFDANLLGVWSSPDGTVIVPGMRHMILSDDAGATWQAVEDGDVNRNWYIDAVSVAGDIYAVGHTGQVILISKEQD